MRVTLWLIFLILTAGCYKSSKPNEKSDNSESGFGETDELTPAIDSERQSSESDVGETAEPTPATDFEEDVHNRRPCLRESSFVDSDGTSHKERAFFFYNDDAESTIAYYISTLGESWDFSTSMGIRSKPIDPFLGTEYWNACALTSKTQLLLYYSGLEAPFSGSKPLVTGFRVSDDGSQVVFEIENGKDGSLLRQEQLSVNENDDIITWKVFPYKGTAWTGKVVFNRDAHDKPIDPIVPEERDESLSDVTVVDYQSGETALTLNIDEGFDAYDGMRTTYEYDEKGLLISYRFEIDVEETIIELECSYDSQGKLLRRKETSSLGGLASATGLASAFEYNYSYSEKGDIISATKSHGSSNGTFLVNYSSPGIRTRADKPFTDFRYKLDDRGQIAEINMGSFVGVVDAKINYEYNDYGNITLAEYSSIDASGPVVEKRMVNTYDELGRLSKTEVFDLSEDASIASKTIHQYLYDCRSYQSVEN